MMPDNEIYVNQAEPEANSQPSEVVIPAQAMSTQSETEEQPAIDKELDKKKDLADRVDQRNDQKKL
jgi:hypothetical protein